MLHPLQVLVYVDHHTIYGTSQKPFCMKFCQFNFRNSVIYTNVQSLCKNIIFIVFFFFQFKCVLTCETWETLSTEKRSRYLVVIGVYLWYILFWAGINYIRHNEVVTGQGCLLPWLVSLRTESQVWCLWCAITSCLSYCRPSLCSLTTWTGGETL